MSQKESILRCLVIVNKLTAAPAPFSAIAEKLKSESELQGYDFNISKRTFQRDIEDIGSVFNIDIKYDFSRKVYYIDSENHPGTSDRMIEALNTIGALNLSDRISDFISFEKRKANGSANISLLLHSIESRKELSFTYCKYDDDEISERVVEPYGLKEFRSRLYLLAKDKKDELIKTFALDRLTGPLIGGKKFKYPEGFSIREYFKDCFGIIKPVDEEVEQVILSFDPLQGRYISSLPLHGSQKVITDNDKELRISLRLYITHDFIMELLSFGESMKVVMPMSLAEELMFSYRNSLDQY
jgi:predicted DNA-binding transcriptional regulator YafY